MVDQLNSFASEVTRVAREVGTDGQLGGQAQVRGVAGVWKDLTDSVNRMAGNLTDQVRGIAKVVTAVANGDLKRKLFVEAKGEIAALADTINEMTDTLATFAEQVTTVAREVGVEGQLGGQAKVPGAAGTWKDLTENVNQLAANLTTQVRAIAEVATAVTKGDLTRSIALEAQGEMAALKDNINEMIRNLRETTQKNNEQDWLKTNLAKFTRMLQGQRDLMTVTKLILSELAPVVSAQHGVFYMMDGSEPEPVLKLTSTYAYRERKGLRNDVPRRRGPGRPVRLREGADPGQRRAGRLRPDQLRAGRGAAAEHRRAAGDLRGPGQGRHRAGLVPPLQGHPPQPARPAHRDHRHRAQHDLGQHADRGPAGAVAVAGQGAAGPAGGAPREEQPPGEAGGDAPGVGGAPEEAAGGAEAGQRGAGDEGRTAQPPEVAGRGARTARSSWPSRSWRRRPSSSP